MAKDSFILYDNYNEHIKLLTVEECGQLLKAIFAHRNGEELPTMTTASKIVFNIITAQLDRDAIKYAERCERYEKLGEYGKLGKDFGVLGKEYGKLGGRPKKNLTPEQAAAIYPSYNELIKNANLSMNVQRHLGLFLQYADFNKFFIKNEELSYIIDRLCTMSEDSERIRFLNKIKKLSPSEIMN